MICLSCGNDHRSFNMSPTSLAVWISVKDRLPLDPAKVNNYETVEVIVATKLGAVFATDFQAGNTGGDPWYKFEETYRGKVTITHWMPLPPAPDQP